MRMHHASSFIFYGTRLGSLPVLKYSANGSLNSAQLLRNCKGPTFNFQLMQMLRRSLNRLGYFY